MRNLFTIAFNLTSNPVFMRTFGTVGRNESAMICGAIPDFGFYVAGTSDAGSAGADDAIWQ